MSKLPLPNRIALYLAAAGNLVAALLPFAVDLGSPAKAVAYASAVLGANAVVVKWLEGWQRYEDRAAIEQLEATSAPEVSGAEVHTPGA